MAARPPVMPYRSSCVVRPGITFHPTAGLRAAPPAVQIPQRVWLPPAVPVHSAAMRFAPSPLHARPLLAVDRNTASLREAVLEKPRKVLLPPPVPRPDRCMTLSLHSARRAGPLMAVENQWAPVPARPNPLRGRASRNSSPAGEGTRLRANMHCHASCSPDQSPRSCLRTVRYQCGGFSFTCTPLLRETKATRC